MIEFISRQEYASRVARILGNLTNERVRCVVDEITSPGKRIFEIVVGRGREQRLAIKASDDDTPEYVARAAKVVLDQGLAVVNELPAGFKPRPIFSASMVLLITKTESPPLDLRTAFALGFLVSRADYSGEYRADHLAPDAIDERFGFDSISEGLEDLQNDEVFQRLTDLALTPGSALGVATVDLAADSDKSKSFEGI